MSQSDNAPKSGNQRLKIGIAVGLGGILAFLMLNSEDKPTATASPATVPNRNALKKQSPPENGLSPATRPTTAITRIPLAEILQYNPFEIDGRIAARETNSSSKNGSTGVGQGQPADRKSAQPHPARAALTRVEANIILESSRGRSVQIGNRVIHEGTIVAEGATARIIDGRGVLVEFQSLRKPARARRPRSARRK